MLSTTESFLTDMKHASEAAIVRTFRLIDDNTNRFRNLTSATIFLFNFDGASIDFL